MISFTQGQPGLEPGGKEASETTDFPEHRSEPTPRFERIEQQRSDRPAMRYLNRYVITPIAPVWYDVGLELFEIDSGDEGQLNALKAEQNLSDKERATRMLTHWLQKKTDASWNDLLEVLRRSNIGLCATAQEIEEMFPEINDSAQTENETMMPLNMVDVTTDAVVKVERFVISNQQQTCKDDSFQETQRGFAKQSLMLVYPTMWPPQQPNTGGIMCGVGSTSHSEDLERSEVKSNGNTLFPVTTSSTPVSQIAHHLLPSTGDIKDMTNAKIEDSKKSERVCEAVSDYYRGQFVDRWKCKTHSSTINTLAALLVERDDEMKVIVFTAGTTKKRECSYALSNASANECMWGHCDGHAVSVCYRLASFYLITEIRRHKKNPSMSILASQPGGYELKKGIEIHFFTTDIPCGIMADNDYYFLSWKIPFKGKPHCLKCSSIILLGAYLGIQGPLSHLLRKPVYVSSITIPKHENITALKTAEIKTCFDKFGLLLMNADVNNYKVHIPHVKIANLQSRQLFLECFAPYKRSSSHMDSDAFQMTNSQDVHAAATVLDPEGNLGSHMMVFTLKTGGMFTEEFRRKMTLQLTDTTKDFPNEVKVSNFNSLREAQLRLCVALDVSKALEKLISSVTERMDKRLTTDCLPQSASEVISMQLKEMKQCRSISTETTLQINKMKNSFCTIIKKFENEAEGLPIAADSLTSLNINTKKLEAGVKSVMDGLDSLNKDMKECEHDIKSIADKLSDYRDYKEALDNLNSLLERANSKSRDTQFHLDLMGCDWARYLVAMHNDIQKSGHNSVHKAPSLSSMPAVEDQWQQLPSTHGSKMLERITKQESQNEMAIERMKSKDSGLPDSITSSTGNYNSLHQVTSLPSLTEEDIQRQQSYLEKNDEVFDEEVVPKQNESSILNINVETSIPLGNEVQEESQRGTKECVIPCSKPIITGTYGSVHQASSGSSSPCDTDQHLQGSKVVFSNVERSIVLKSQSLNHTAVTYNTFGCDLTELAKADDSIVPKFLIRCTKEIEERGLKVIGVYRFSGNAEKIQKLRHRIDQDLPVDFTDQEWEDISIIPGALKLFLRELPDPLIPFNLYNKFIEAGKLKPPQKIVKLRSCVKELPTANYKTLTYLSNHLRKVMEYSSVNKMQSVNLAIAFGPIIMRSRVNSVANASLIPVQSKVMEAFLTEYHTIFS